MSKFFEKTRKAHDWAAYDSAAPNLDAGPTVAAIKEADGAATDLSESRLRGCRKIELARQPAMRVLYDEKTFGDVAAESYRVLRTRLMRAQAANGFRSVVLGSPIGGEGKTLTALNLAISCAKLAEMKVLLIDADLRNRGLTSLLGNLPGPGLAEILAGRAQPHEAIMATELPNLHVLGSGTPIVPPAEAFASHHWKDFIGWCSECFQLILVDTPPVLPVADFELITAACDGVLFVVRALSTSRELLRKACNRIESRKLLGVVLNAADLNGENQASYYYGPQPKK